MFWSAKGIEQKNQQPGKHDFSSYILIYTPKAQRLWIQVNTFVDKSAGSEMIAKAGILKSGDTVSIRLITIQ